MRRWIIENGGDLATALMMLIGSLAVVVMILVLGGCSSDGAAFRFDDSASSGSVVEFFPWRGAKADPCCPGE